MASEVSAAEMDERRPGRWSPVREEAERIASALPALLVEAERVAATVAQGVHGRRRVGTGETFWQFRRYNPGDSSSLVDWRRSARSQHLFVRENEWEAAQSVWLWRDPSASMHYGTTGPEKAHRAGVLALALGILLVQGGERIAALDQPWPPQSGRLPLRRLAYLYSARAKGSPADLDSLPPMRQLPRFCHLVWVSDFLAEVEPILERIRGFARGGVTGHLLQVLDPAEADFPFAGRIRFEDIERHDTLIVGRAESLKSDYRNRLAALQETIGREARRLGWTFAVHRSDHSPETALLALFQAVSAGKRL